MQINLTSLMTILGMALITYLTRIGGVWLIRFIPLSKRLKAWVDILPGTILMAIVAPTVFSTGFAEVGASLATVLVFVRTRNILLAMLVGIAAVVGLRILQTHL
jgi:uncharacterized membrane protein